MASPESIERNGTPNYPTLLFKCLCHCDAAFLLSNKLNIEYYAQDINKHAKEKDYYT
jgi:hypothetical protein